MAHDINNMIYVGEVPWHGLGVRLPARATYDEIVEAAGFYDAVERDVFIPPFNSPIPDKKALVRGDTGAYLSVVGKSYEVVQFADVARTLVEAAGDVKAVFTTAGTLGPVGIRGWLLGELPEPVKVRGDESPIRKYILGCAGHDGYTAVVIKNVATRVVCANTLGVALGERGGASWRIQHTASAKERLDEAGKAFRRIAQSYETFDELANVMAGTRFTSKQMQATLDGILPVPPDEKDHRRLLVEREKVTRLYETAVGVEKLRGTGWGAFQSWTEYADHHQAGTRFLWLKWFDRNGIEKRRSSETENEADARAILAKIEEEEEEHAPRSMLGELTVERWHDETWLPQRQKEWPSAWRTDRTRLKHHFLPTFGGWAIRDDLPRGN